MANIVIMGTEHHDMAESYIFFLMVMEYTFTVICEWSHTLRFCPPVVVASHVGQCISLTEPFLGSQTPSSARSSCRASGAGGTSRTG